MARLCYSKQHKSQARFLSGQAREKVQAMQRTISRLGGQIPTITPIFLPASCHQPTDSLVCAEIQERVQRQSVSGSVMASPVLLVVLLSVLAWLKRANVLFFLDCCVNAVQGQAKRRKANRQAFSDVSAIS